MTKLWVEESALFPMFWIEEFAEIDETYQRTISDQLTWPLKVIRAIQWTLVSYFTTNYLKSYFQQSIRVILG